MKDNNYFVYEHITPDGMYYIGVTNNIKRRWESNGVHYKRASLQPYIEQYGWENIQHQVLFSNQTKENALKIEDFLIITATEDGVCINQRRSGLITEKINVYQREYRKTHQDELRVYRRKYKRKYRKTHREELNVYMRSYRQRKKSNKQLKEL
jgi:predicted GIY-YIG superfamily endonuclease